jgi:hypothetical protein
MNEVTGPCVGVKFTSLTPSDVADSVENERNRLLAPVMMDSRPSAGLDRKNAAPQGRIDEGYRCNSRAAFRTLRLGGAKVELRGLTTRIALLSIMGLPVGLERRSTGSSAGRRSALLNWCLDPFDREMTWARSASVRGIRKRHSSCETRRPGPAATKRYVREKAWMAI